MARLNGTKVAVIGGASGIGYAVAAKLGHGARGLTVNVKDEASVAAFFDTIGPFDHLVFTAGDWGHMTGATSSLDVEASKSRTEVRFWGAVRAAKHAIRHIS